MKAGGLDVERPSKIMQAEAGMASLLDNPFQTHHHEYDYYDDPDIRCVPPGGHLRAEANRGRRGEQPRHARGLGCRTLVSGLNHQGGRH